jgi:hypothetical protein
MMFFTSRHGVLLKLNVQEIHAVGFRAVLYKYIHEEKCYVEFENQLEKENAVLLIFADIEKIK